MRSLFCCLALLSLASCSFGQTIAQHAIDYNKTVAESDDAQTLLNVVRASVGAPTHFTVIRDFTGRLKHTASSSFGLTVPFGGDAARNFPFNSQAQFAVESNPLFNVDNSGNSQEFVNALTSPIDLDTAKIFWDQGWPRDLLLYLLVEKIEAGKEGDSNEPAFFKDIRGEDCRGVGSVVENDPEDPVHARCFASIVSYLVEEEKNNSRQTKLRLIEEYSGIPIGPKLEKTDVKDLEKLLEIREKKLHLVSVNENHFQLCEAEKITSFRVTSDGSCVDTITDLRKACTQDDSGYQAAQRKADLGKTGTYQFTANKCKKVPIVYSAKLRSLQGVIYFIGEIVRSEGRHNVWVRPNGVVSGCPDTRFEKNEKRIPLFKSQKGEPRNAAVAVDYHGETHWLPPNDGCTRSLQTLAFLNQISGLYQSRADRPTPTTIQTIDR